MTKLLTDTPGGIFPWTIPEGNDPIADIASIIEDGLTDIQNQFFIASDSKANADAWDTYPLGVSVMAITGTGQTNGVWPSQGSVLSVRRGASGNQTAQLLLGGFVTSGGVIRYRIGSDAGWSPWLIIGSNDQPQAEATGAVTGTPPAGGGVVAIPVTWPANRFVYGVPLRCSVWLVNTTRPDLSACSVGNVSSSGCTIYIYRDSDTATSVAWHTVQGVEAP